MTARWRFPLALAGALAAGVAALALPTDGFRVWTTDGARALAVARAPQALPALRLIGSDGDATPLADPRRLTVVDFFYSDCPTLCVTLTANYQRLQSRIAEAGLGDRVRLLSISFDPARDTPARLAEFATRHGVRGDLWQVAVPADAPSRAAALAAFGVVVIPDGRGGFEHNAALHLVDETGQLIAILPPDAVDDVLLEVAHRRRPDVVLAGAP